MNDRVRETEDQELRITAQIEREGMLAWCWHRITPKVDAPTLLASLGKHGARDDAERLFLTQLLYAIAQGEDVCKALRIDKLKIGHRPPGGAGLADKMAAVVDRRVRAGEARVDVVAGMAAMLNISPAAVVKAIARASDKRKAFVACKKDSR